MKRDPVDGVLVVRNLRCVGNLARMKPSVRRANRKARDRGFPSAKAEAAYMAAFVERMRMFGR